MNLRVPALILLLFATGAHAQVPPPEAPAMSAEDAAQMQAAQQTYRAYSQRIAEDMVASGHARDLVLAAALLELATWNPPQDGSEADSVPSQPSPRDARIDQWRRLASARAGSDVIANALLMGAGLRTTGDAGLRDEALGRWRRLEPDNLWPLVHGAGDIDALLAQARKTKRFDGHLYQQARWVQSALLAHPPTEAERAALGFGNEGLSPDESAAMRAMSIVLASAIPPLQPLVETCGGEALSSTSTRVDDCRHVARVMADESDASVGTSVGIRLLEQLAANDAERTRAQARRRRMDWQMLGWGRLSAAQPRDGAAQFVRLLHDPAVHGEQDLLERVLEEAGVALDPPAGWRSPRR